MSQSDDAFQKLCLEAVLAVGPDIAAVEAYVHQRKGAMEPADRERLNRDIERVLSFRAPGFRERNSH